MNKTVSEILKILEMKKGRAISGEEIARELNITRSAVWKNIKRLKMEGYKINSTNNKGYELTEENDIFSGESILAEILTGPEIGLETKFKIELREEVGSTNSVLKQKAREGGEEGYILVAKKQTEGRGRLGRSFFSPKKGIYLSFILRPKLAFHESLLLTTIAAVSVCDTIREVTGKEVGIKWVNDVYLDGKKICGILTEAEANVENGFLSYAVVGIGLNLTEPEEGLGEDLKDIAGFLFDKEDAPQGVMTKLTASILRHYFYYYENLSERLFMKVYQENQILVGKEIFVITPDQKKKARVLGVDDEARLMVEYENGEKESLFTGEVSVREVGSEEQNQPKF